LSRTITSRYAQKYGFSKSSFCRKVYYGTKTAIAGKRSVCFRAFRFVYCVRLHSKAAEDCRTPRRSRDQIRRSRVWEARLVAERRGLLESAVAPIAAVGVHSTTVISVLQLWRFSSAFFINLFFHLDSLCPTPCVKMREE
jgi:hypothetical protein